MQQENNIKKIDDFINQITEKITFGFITYLKTNIETINILAPYKFGVIF